MNTAVPASRLLAIDWMYEAHWFRGRVIALPGTLQFLHRFVTHLCAPTFVFLAGTALALSVARRRAAGEAESRIDARLVKRGLFIAALEIWMSVGSGVLVLQVLYAIGISMVCMAALRRLPVRALAMGAIAWFLVQDAVLRGLGLMPGLGFQVPGSLFLVPGFTFIPGFAPPPPIYPIFIALYPVLPWLAIMAGGWCFGSWLQGRAADDRVPERRLLLAGLAGLAIFIGVRVGGGYGNLFMPPVVGTLPGFLLTSKYPPSLAFVAAQLGLMALLLAGLFRVQRSGRRPLPLEPLRIFGSSALFFYVIHVHLLLAAAMLILGMPGRAGMGAARLATLGALVVLLPVCAWFLRQRTARPGGWTRFF
ncbi:MAG TPA: heparan-alpha-glucosaminide N-acetyltransferase domain-containing protein [Planctomycetota bacterium]